MDSIIDALEKEIPQGPWCHNHNGWCKYHEQKKPTLADNGAIQINYCNLSEEYVNKKECEINL